MEIRQRDPAYRSQLRATLADTSPLLLLTPHQLARDGRGRCSSPNGGTRALTLRDASAVDIKCVGETSHATWLKRGLHGDHWSGHVNLPLLLFVFILYGEK